MGQRTNRGERRGLATSYEDFVGHLLARDDIQGDTPRVFRQRLAALRTWIRATKARDPLIEDLDWRTIKQFTEQGFTQSTAHAYQGTLRAILNWGFEVGLLRSGMPAGANLTPAPTTDNPPVSFTDAELGAIMARLRRDRSSSGLRLLAACGLLADTGSRPQEISSLTFERMDLDRRVLIVHGKRAKERAVPISVGAAALMSDYLRVRGSDAPDAPVFISLRRRGGAYSGISPSAINTDFVKVLRALGFKTRALRSRPDGLIGMDTYSLYTLKHTFCRRFAERGGSVLELLATIGHAPGSLEVLYRHYYAPSRERLRVVHGSLDLDDVLRPVA